MKIARITGFLGMSLLCLCCGALAQTGWHPKAAPLATHWAAAVSPGTAHKDYPRPTMVRPEWQSLNGLWEYAITHRDSGNAGTYAGQILVPFPIESALSGVMKPVTEQQRLWYRRTFAFPEGWEGRRVLLHFEAVDWEARAWVDGRELGVHQGGYDAFSFDITDALLRTNTHQVVVSVYDPTDFGPQARGKQKLRPDATFYSACSGIWQSVWLEPVNAASIASLSITPQLAQRRVRVGAKVRGSADGVMVEAVASAAGREFGRVVGSPGEPLELKLSEVTLWSPDSPFLYDLKVRLLKGAQPVDEVGSYFGMREVAVARDESGFPRILLNGKALFQCGLLDHGYWPEGIYTAPSDEALRFDVFEMKRWGFNTSRKHVKVEPERWYYWCDKLGLLVWQDMPCGDRFTKRKPEEIQRTPESARRFDQELTRMVQGRGNHPSIILWVAFNEGWGQFDTVRVTQRIKDLDPSRLVISASGWNDKGVGDVRAIHRYTGSYNPQFTDERAIVLGEWGGLGLPLPGREWDSKKSWSYFRLENPDAWTDAYRALAEKVQYAVERKGLSGAIFTQWTDVETEINGILTYNREPKVSLEKVLPVNQALCTTVPRRAASQPPAESGQKTGSAASGITQ